MGKRQATGQITKDAFYDDEDEEQQTNESTSKPIQASSEILSTRKILKPRGKLGENSNGFKPAAKPTSAFSFTPSTQTSTPFTFSAPKPANTSAGAAGSIFTTTAPAATATTSTSLPPASEQDNKLRALNENFVKKVNECNAANKVANLSDIAEKYIQYYKLIATTTSTTTSTSTSSTTTNNTTQFTTQQPAPPKVEQLEEKQDKNVTKESKSTTPDSESESESDSESDDDATTKKEIKVQGPLFTFNTGAGAKSSSPFTFDPKKISKLNEKDPDDSDDDIEIKGPTFNFNKPIKDNVFKFKSQNGDNNNNTGANASANNGNNGIGFSFGANQKNTELESKSSEQKGGVANANAATANATPQNPFSFLKPNTETKQEPFKTQLNESNGKSEEPKEVKKPAFSFTPTANKEDSGSAATKPSGFQFGTPASTTASNTSASNTSAPTTAFQFGASKNPSTAASNTIQNNTPSAPSAFPTSTNATTGFKFGNSTTSTSFQPTTTTTTAPSTSMSTAPSGAFQFGSKPSFGAPATSAAAPFSKPESESLNSTSALDSGKPKPFLFGTSSLGTNSDSTAKPSFQFGSSSGFGSDSQPSSQPAPIFNFGKPANANANATAPATATTATSQQPASDSSKSTQSSSSPFVFGAKPAATTSAFPLFNFTATQSSQLEKKDNNKTEGADEEDKVEEEEVEGNFKPVAQLGEKQDVQSGEENEEVKYSARTKLMLLDTSNKTNPYINKGIGELRILYNPETTKSRILIRAEASQRVLLNTLLSKDITYESMGNGSLIRVPVFGPESKVETYVIKLKTAADGLELLKVINEVKA